MAQKREEYKGHRIELRAPKIQELSERDRELEVERKAKQIQPELLIDDTRLSMGNCQTGNTFCGNTLMTGVMI